VVQDLPAVGENLQDHLTVNVIQGLKGVTTFYEESRPLALLANLGRYALRGGGLLAHPAAQVGVFFRSDDRVPRPDAQVHFAPAASETDSAGKMRTRPGTTATVCYLRPQSRGHIHIRCSDPGIAPAICANYLDAAVDREALVAALRRVRACFAAPALDPHRGREYLPGPGVQSDEAILAYIREQAESVYHPVGTCRMGADPESVVDERLRVRGIAGLRVADASVMPTLVSGNTNAPTIMIAEKCADLLLEDAGVAIGYPEDTHRRRPATRANKEAVT
jgi:choline dehydrogenase